MSKGLYVIITQKKKKGKERVEENAFLVYNNLRKYDLIPEAFLTTKIQMQNLHSRKYGGGISMLTLQEQVVQKVNGLSEDNLQFLLEMIERFMQPDSVEEKTNLTSNRIGIAKGQDLYDDDYDFDEMNPAIEKLFGETE